MFESGRFNFGFFLLLGIFLATSPLFVLGDENILVPDGAAGEAFCKIIWSNYFLWVFAKFSVAIVTLMAVERWFAIAQPMKYKVMFQRKKVVKYSIILAILSMLLSVQIIFENHRGEKNGKNNCFYKSLITPKAAENAVNIIYCFITVFLPLMFITGTNAHLWKILKSQISSETINTRRHLELRLLRMSLLVALCIAICFVPNQISYILAMTLDSHPYSSPIHFATVVLSMSNSCLNPFIYCLTNKHYRKEISRLFCWWKLTDENQAEVGRVQMQTAATLVNRNDSPNDAE